MDKHTPRLHFQVHLTDDCNMECRHCYSANRGTSISSEQFDYFLDEVLKYKAFLEADLGKAVFCGGEPLLSPLLLDSIRKCIRAGFKGVSVLSNGVLLTNDYARDLVAAGCREIQICIEGDRESHNSVRDGTWDQVLKAWDIARKNGLRVYNQTTITTENFDQVDEVIRTCRGKVAFTGFLKHIPNGKMDALSPSQWLDVLERVFYGYVRYGKAYRDFVHIKDLFWARIFTRSTYVCGLRIPYPLIAIIESNGDVYPCRRAGISVGNVYSKGLVEIYKNNVIMNRTRDLSQCHADCQDCGRLDECGGCPGISMNLGGDTAAKDDLCIRDEMASDLRRARQRRRGVTIEVPDKGAVGVNMDELGRFIRLTDSADIEAASQELAERKLAAREASRSGIRVAGKELQEATDMFRQLNGLNSAQETRRWLRGNGLSIPDLETLIEDNIRIFKHTRSKENLPDRTETGS